MNILEQMIVNSLLEEYPLCSAIKQVKESFIQIKDNYILVVWENGKTNTYNLNLKE